MAADNRLELIVEMDPTGANRGIKEVNSNLSDMEKQMVAFTRGMSAGMDKMEGSVRKGGGAVSLLEKQAKDTGSAFAVLGQHITDFAHNPLEAAQSGIGGLLEKMGPLAVGFGAVAGGVLAAGAALVEMGIDATEQAKQLKNTSIITGETTQNIQALNQIAKEAGLEGLDLGRVIGKLNSELGSENGKDFTKILKDFNISLKDGSGASKDAITLIDELGTKLKSIEDPIIRAQLQNQALGGRLRDLQVIMMGENKTIAEQIEIMKKTGPVWDDVTQNKLLQFHEALDIIGRTWSSLVTDIKAGVGSIFGDLSHLAMGGEKSEGTLEQQVKAAMADQFRTKPEFGPSKFVLDTTKFFRPGYKSDEEKKAEEQARKNAEVLRFYNETLAASQARGTDWLRIVAAMRKDYEDIQRPLQEMTKLQADFTREIEKGAKASEDLYFSTTAEMAKGDRERLKDILDGVKGPAEAIEKSSKKSWDEFERAAKQSIENTRDAAGHIFDDLMSGSKDIWSDLLRTFKGIFLTPVRMAFQDLAQMMFTGTSRSGGIMGGLSGVFGASTPGFAGGWPGMGGGSAGGASGSGGGGFGGLGGLMNMGGLQQFFGFGGAGGANLQNSIGGSGMFGNLSKLGKSNAALLGGGLLAYDGLRRGGLFGLGETTAGGAMIGFKYGGPLGAAIGAGIGAIAGTIRLFIKGATEKAREKVKATYGVDIKDKGVLGQIVDMAKQGFGGNLDMAIRSQQVRDLVELYSMTTGQKPSGMPAKMTSSTLMQSGGSLFQQSNYSNGSAMPSLGGLPGTGLNSLGASNAGAMNVTINLSPAAAQNLLTQGVLKIMDANPRAVQTASMSATRQNSNRRELTSLQLSPGTLTS